MMRPNYSIDIDKLIRHLEDEKARGATKVILWGIATLISDRNNNVILTTEPQM